MMYTLRTPGRYWAPGQRNAEDDFIVSRNTLQISRAIEKSKSNVTILFTDIVNSTQFWDKYGDTAGRLMLDRHNTLLFPVVKAFRGTLIKTIGDSIMASFKYPEDGVNAAIAMQQQLRAARREKKDFNVHIRIGVHTGKALVEANDVFGDTVNVAARVESAAGTDEILVSQDTALRLKRRKSEFGLHSRRHFVPKGKRKKQIVWECSWKSLENRTGVVRPPRLIPPNRRQRVELAVYLLGAMLSIYFMYDQYIRYLVRDMESLAAYRFFSHTGIAIGAMTGLTLLLSAAFRIGKKISRPPVLLFRLLKGGTFFGLLFFPAVFLFQFLDLSQNPWWNEPLHRAQHQLVEIVSDNAQVHQKPSRNARVLDEARKNDVFILKRTAKTKNYRWHLVTLGNRHPTRGFIAERLPPRVGVPPLIQTERVAFTIRYYHLYAFGLGLLGWLFGVFTFRLKPL
jgi:class 3 adenylate cyclase